MSERNDMTPERLRHLLDAYGANASRWPSGERDAMLALLERSPELASWQRQAAELDGLLDQATLPTADRAFMDGLANAAGTPVWRQWTVLIWPFGPIWKPALGLTMAAVFGAVLGYVTTPPVELAQISREIESLILG